MALRSSSRNSVVTIRARAAPVAGFKRCCLTGGDLDGSNRDYFFPRLLMLCPLIRRRWAKLGGALQRALPVSRQTVYKHRYGLSLPKLRVGPLLPGVRTGLYDRSNDQANLDEVESIFFESTMRLGVDRGVARLGLGAESARDPESADSPQGAGPEV
jgi:hypothetical protein